MVREIIRIFDTLSDRRRIDYILSMLPEIHHQPTTLKSHMDAETKPRNQSPTTSTAIEAHSREWLQDTTENKYGGDTGNRKYWSW